MVATLVTPACLPACRTWPPKELELLVCGSRQLDLFELEAATLYEDGYTAHSEVRCEAVRSAMPYCRILQERPPPLAHGQRNARRLQPQGRAPHADVPPTK